MPKVSVVRVIKQFKAGVHVKLNATLRGLKKDNTTKTLPNS